MKKIILFLTGCFPFAVAGNGEPDTAGWYLSSSLSMLTDFDMEARVGGDWHTLKNRVEPFENLSYKITLGYEFEDSLRLEMDILSTTIRGINIDAARPNYNIGVESLRLLYDIHTGYRVYPYAGTAVYGINLNGNLDYDVGVIIGFSFRVGNRLSADFEYQRNWYRRTGDMYVDGFGLTPDARIENGVNRYRIATRTRF